MTLPNSGALALSQIQSEFGGSNPISLSEYYRGGSLVPSHGNTTGIPSSGTISISQFYGKSNTAPIPTSYNYQMQAGNGGVSYGYSAVQVLNFGSLQNNPQPVAFSNGFNPTWDAVRDFNSKGATDFFIIANGQLPDSGWTSLSISGTSIGTVSLNRTSASSFNNVGTTQWRWNGVNWRMPSSGANTFIINQ